MEPIISQASYIDLSSSLKYLAGMQTNMVQSQAITKKYIITDEDFDKVLKLKFNVTSDELTKIFKKYVPERLL